MLGALAAALIRGQFAWQSFESPRQTGRYMAGAALMGVGGVLAGGCTVGAGVSGIPTLSVAAILAIASIGLGGWITRAALNAATAEVDGSATTPTALPAE